MQNRDYADAIVVDFHSAPTSPQPPLLFVHGFPLNRSMWQTQQAAFSGVFPLILPDLRGLGDSRIAAADVPAVVTMEDFADDLLGILDRRGIERVTLCGLSMGGYIAWQFVRKYPERLQSLILCDTRAVADSPEASAGREKLAVDVLTKGPGIVADAMLPKLLSPRTAERRPELVTQVRNMILSQDPSGIVAALRGMARRPDAHDLLPGIRVRTLVIVGADDKISPPDEMRGIASAIPGAQFEMIPDAGHLAPLENPQAVNEAIRKFLET